MKHWKILYLLCCVLIFSCNNDEDDPGPSGSGVDEPQTCDGATSITDPRDGQIYEIVQIGGECWFAENLRHAPVNVPQVSNSFEFIAMGNTTDPDGEAAWCYYQNDASNNAIYGKLYNWYAVNDGNLCPDGWHVPTDQDWKLLELALGMPLEEIDLMDFRGEAQNIGGKMKTKAGWDDPNEGATNESGFSGVAGGELRSSFTEYGNSGYWWTSSSTSFETAAYNRRLSKSQTGIRRGYTSKDVGKSCRCVKDS